MPEFLKLIPVQQALQILLTQMQVKIIPECIDTLRALGRVTTKSIFAPIPLPSFPRSAVDGYAVRAEDTYGASESLPAYLRVIGEILMGKSPGFDINHGEIGLIHTGGMLPESCNAVVMVEYTQPAGTETVEILRPVAVGENTIKAGEDVRMGEEIIPSGSRIRSAEIGGMAAIGMTEVEVARKPIIGIISTGDEVIPPEKQLLPGQVWDINSYSLSALIEQTGAIPKKFGVFPDQVDILEGICFKAIDECDALIITAGSSASSRDLTAGVINKLGSPGVLVHGVNIRPGKPTILAICNNKVVIGLPGNPVSALVIAGLFVVPVIESMLGLNNVGFRPHFLARLSNNIPSQAGREDWVPARLSIKQGENQVEPIFSKSNLIFSLVRANSMIRIPADVTGLRSGELVEVFLFA